VWPIIGSVTVVSLAPFVAPWLRSQGTTGVAYFVAALAAIGVVAFAPTNVTAVLAGWLFGFPAAALAFLGATIVGAAGCYAVARAVAGGRVTATFADHPRWELVRRALVEAGMLKALWLVTLLRLSPVLPFGTTNVLLATTRVPIGTYVAGTLLGLAPRAAVITFAAAKTEQLDLSAGGGWPLLAMGIAGTALCIVVLAVLGRRALNRAVPGTPFT
jgi:uncharacterized membrane protein YdjX (TVP38/TMEM64 family)